MRHGGLTSNPSASKTECFVECPASHCFPQAPEQTAQAVKGTGGHKPITDSINGSGPRLALADQLTEGVDSLLAEAAYVVNVKKKTSRLVGVDIGRNYGPLDLYDVPVSLDAQGRLNELTLWLRDWKFGTYSSRWQLDIQAMALLFRDQTAIMVDAGFVYINDDSKPFEETFRIGRMELDEKADQVVEAFDRVRAVGKTLREGGTPSLNQGPWCKYCPSRDLCPAKWATLRGALGELAPLSEDMLQALSLEKCGEIWEYLRDVQKLAEKAQETLKDRLASMPRGEGYPLRNGKVVTMQPRKGWAYPQKDKTMALLEELGATKKQVGDIMVMRPDTYAAVERVKK